MHEELWWYLYISILNEENKKKKEMYDTINALLPWLNYELWRETQKKGAEGRENVTFDQQLQGAFQGQYDTGVPGGRMLDDLTVDTSGSSVTEHLRQMFDQTASSAPGMFDPPPQQHFGSIKDTLFPNQPPPTDTKGVK